MELTQLQTSDLIIGQPLPWDLFDQELKQLRKRGYIIKTMDELKQLEQLSKFRNLEPSLKQEHPPENHFTQFFFEDMQLKVGQKLQLKLASQAKSHSGEANGTIHTASLIGYVQNSTLIVSMPPSDHLMGEPFLEGDQIIVRLFSGQCAFSFTTFVDKIIKLPFKYLHLSFPKQISGQVIRKSRRIKCNIIAALPDPSIPLVITDLSTTGAEISTTVPLGEIGSAMMLSFSIHVLNKDIPISVKCVIRSAKEINKNNQKTLCFGVEFIELKQDYAFSIHSLIYQEIVENPFHAA